MPRVAPVLAALVLLTVAAPASGAPLKARGSVEQAYVTGAAKGKRVTLVNAKGKVVARGKADRFGSRIFRNLRPDPGYRVKSGGRDTKRFAVLKAGANPKPRFYRRKTLRPGLNYVKVRDGIELAMTVRLPSGKSFDDGPFPTLVEYSGYQVAAPHDLLSTIVNNRPDPLAPASSTAVGSLIAPLLGFAGVSVQMRGSGCSGGAFGLFDLPTTYDGYDAIETVAAQDWVKGGKVGMAGISFSGITQLFTAGTRPPHLAAISPMSVTDDLYNGTGNPGGIPNSGFARTWIQERMDDAEPAPKGGQPYARALVKQGDRHCRRNQRLRLQTQDGIALTERTPQRAPRIYDDRSPARWMGRIRVPTFLVGSFQDEQTSGHFAASLGRLRTNPRTWFTLQNGVHADSLTPSAITRWVEFLKLYVADEVPSVPDAVRSLSGQLYQFLADAPASPVEQSRFAGGTDVAAARATFERDPRVRLLMENGAGPAGLGSIGASWELGFGAWPIPEAVATDFFLGAGGALTPAAPAPGTAEYLADPAARPATTLPGDGDADAWKAQPPYDWTPLADGRGVGFATAPLQSDAVIAGTPELDLRISASAGDTDLQVTLSEIRPDGRETYVQNGWLRASHRHGDAPRSRLRPIPAGETVTAKVPLFPVAHAFRAGSRIRVTVEAPGGDRPRWRFDSVDDGSTRVTVHLGQSKLTLPILRGVTAPKPLPAPTALRGQPSRIYVPATNGG
jgi:predicted acyl esterase